MKTVRSYYRNSVLAFPKTVEYGCAIERPPRRIGYGASIFFLCVVAITVLVSLYFRGAMK